MVALPVPALIPTHQDTAALAEDVPEDVAVTAAPAVFPVRLGLLPEARAPEFHRKCAIAPLTINGCIVVRTLCHLHPWGHLDVFRSEVGKVLPVWRHRQEWLQMRRVELDLWQAALSRIDARQYSYARNTVAIDENGRAPTLLVTARCRRW